ncbi:MAG: polysaccharide deacetylase family protein [Anaerolineales bacterium]|nr:polysaccharide deacetylase family protein [Anaerolineales bacterium]
MGPLDRLEQESQPGSANQLLGFPADARLLIINADDFGMCHAVNQAIMTTLLDGIVGSTTLMAPCPWAGHAMRFLAEHPEIPFGVHLTVIADWPDYRWGPISPRAMVPSLLTPAGSFRNFDQMGELFAHADPAELEREFRAQIELVLAAGLQPTHLDWHSLRVTGHDEVVDLMVKLARDYGLALRVMGRQRINALQSQGLPTNDYDFLDSYLLDPASKMAAFARLLRELPAGLSEWAVHPGLDNAELQAIDPGGSHFRQADFDFLTAPQARDLIAAEGIILLDYRTLQAVWSQK